MSKERYLFIFGFFICALLSGVAFYYNYVREVPVCPLCSLQLLTYYVIGIISLVAFFHEPEKAGRATYASAIILLALAGLVFASRQIWMQQLPAAMVTPGCSPSLMQVWSSSSFGRMMSVAFTRAEACSMVHWSFMSFSMAAWSLFFYGILILTSIMSFFVNDQTTVSDVATA
jgi:disulfide bond formation protein DsbB